MTQQTDRFYLPAAGRDWALPLYDPLVKLLGGDSARRELIAQAAISSGHRILDIGCGTGTLLVLIKRLYPDSQVVGIDPDPKALALAEKKSARAQVAFQLDRGFSDQLPYPKASFDRVFSSFMYHHLKPNDRETTLREVRRVLKPGGFFHMVDFSSHSHSRSGLANRIHSSDQLKDNSQSRILELMGKAGFAESRKVNDRKMLLGLMKVAYYEGIAG